MTSTINELSNAAAPTSELDEGARITMISCGGAAQALCRGMRPAALGLTLHLALDSSLRALRACHPESQTCLVSTPDGKPKTPAAARQATQQLASTIGSVMHGSHLLIIAAGLGGAAGTGMALGVQDIAADLGIPTLLVLTSPFAFEDSARHQIAEQALAELRRAGRHLLKIDLKILSTAKGPETQLTDALIIARKAFEQALAHTAGRWQQQSCVGVDFDEFVRMLGPDNESRISCVGWGEARGSNRVQQATWLALNHPLLRQTLRNTEQLTGISVTLQCDYKTMRLANITTVMDTIKARVSENTDFFYDTAVGVGDAMQISLMAIGRPDAV